MSDVTFTEEVPMTAARPPKEPKGLYKLVIQWKWAKDEEGAKLVLVLIAVAALAIAVIYPFLVL